MNKDMQHIDNYLMFICYNYSFFITNMSQKEHYSEFSHNSIIQNRAFSFQQSGQSGLDAKSLVVVKL